MDPISTKDRDEASRYEVSVRLWDEVSTSAGATARQSDAGDPVPPRIPVVGSPMSLPDFTTLLNGECWDELAALWPSLTPRQRSTVIYAAMHLPLPPGFGPYRSNPTDWLLAMVLLDPLAHLVKNGTLDPHQIRLAWREPVRLLPAALRGTAAADWLVAASRIHRRNDTLRAGLLTRPDQAGPQIVASRAESLDFALAWSIATPLTTDTARAVVGHPRATVRALRELQSFFARNGDPEALTALVRQERVPPKAVPTLLDWISDADAQWLRRLRLSDARLVAILDEPDLSSDHARRLIRSHATAGMLASRLNQSERVLTALFDALDWSQHPGLVERALSSRRVAVRRALASTTDDPSVLASLAADRNEQVRRAAAARVLTGLGRNPVDAA